MEEPKHSQESEQEFHSINDVLKAWKQHYSGKPQIFYIAHMAILIPYLVIRYALLVPVLKYSKDLWAEQNGSLYRNRK
jgi:hypothetical protein